MMLIDTHAHLDFPEFAEDLDHVLLRAKQAGVERIITIGTTLQSSRKAIQLAERLFADLCFGRDSPEFGQSRTRGFPV